MQRRQSAPATSTKITPNTSDQVEIKTEHDFFLQQRLKQLEIDIFYSCQVKPRQTSDQVIPDPLPVVCNSGKHSRSSCSTSCRPEGDDSDNLPWRDVTLPGHQRSSTVSFTGVHTSLHPPGAYHLGQDGLARVGVQRGAVGVGHDGNLRGP